jgi:hypothetical protein
VRGKYTHYLCGIYTDYLCGIYCPPAEKRVSKILYCINDGAKFTWILMKYCQSHSLHLPPIYENCWCLSIMKTKSSTKLKIIIIKKIFIINKNTIGIFISGS